MNKERKMNKYLKLFLGILGAIIIFVCFAVLFFYQINKKFNILSKDNIVSVAVVYNCKIDRSYENGNYYLIEYKYKFDNKYFKSNIVFNNLDPTEKLYIIKSIQKNKFLVVISKKNPETHCVIFNKKIDKQFKLGDTLPITIDQDVLQENLSNQSLFFSGSTEFYDNTLKEKKLKSYD